MNRAKNFENEVFDLEFSEQYELENLRKVYEKVSLEYAYASGIASKSGLNLLIYGKRVKPYLRNKMLQLEKHFQLELPL